MKANANSSITNSSKTIAQVVCLAACVLAAGCRPAHQETEVASQVVDAMNRGVGLMGQYQYDQAVGAFQEALAAQPGLPEAQINLAISLFNRNDKEKGDLDAGMRLLDALLEEDPAQVRALYFKGIVLQHIGQTDAAISCFQQVVSQRPEDGAAWYLLGLCLQRAEQPATEALSRALQYKPYLYSACYKLAQIALAEGDQANAKRYLDQFKTLRESPLGESIELPQYNQMGDLALVQPLPAQHTRRITRSRYESEPPRSLYASDQPLLWSVAGAEDGAGPQASRAFGGLAAGDCSGDGRIDLVLTRADPNAPGSLVLLLGQEGGAFRDGTLGSGLESVRKALSCALGDFDNDDMTDLFVACAGRNHLFKGRGDGTFSDVTQATGTGEGEAVSTFVMFVDADHDADLDILVCNSRQVDGGGATANQLLNNNADGTFTDIAAQAGIDCADTPCVSAAAGDIDEDRDLDLILFRQGKPARIFLNELSGTYREMAPPPAEILGGRGSVLQDFNGDGHLDVLALGDNPAALQLYLGTGTGQFALWAPFADAAGSAASWGAIRGLRVLDIDLDSDLDIALFSEDGHLLLNDGTGRFVFQSRIWPARENQRLLGAELLDLNGDYVADLLSVAGDATGAVSMAAGKLTPPSSGLMLQLTGRRGRDGRTRSPASGFGVKVRARVGWREQTLTYTGLWGGPNQSSIPMSLGLDGAAKADFVDLFWPDGVSQMEMGLAAGQRHAIAETQRKISSCPVLFAWNGERFEFVTDFAGVGGLGYYVAPGESAPPQALEHIKIEATQLAPKDGCYEVRVCEPMEESAYLDRLELLAVDHAVGDNVFPDERLAITGPPPTHQLLIAAPRFFPTHATGPAGQECRERLARADRHYAYEPPLDRRFIGFCKPHALTLDFGEDPGRLDPKEKVFLFIRGSIEYPYSQTVYAASQARVGWQPIRIERWAEGDVWKTIVPDAGVPGGTDRMMTVDLSGQLGESPLRLRLVTNLEIYYDQVYLAKVAQDPKAEVRPVPLQNAVLRRVGFAREYSPDGRLPVVYDYDLTDPTAPFHVLRGAYTRYGPVEQLLASADDRFALMGPGDEIALRFDAEALPPVPADKLRSFILVSHAYCKDMDLYTAKPVTLEPLPFRAMSRYPYPSGEHYPDDENHQRYREQYNTRIVE